MSNFYYITSELNECYEWRFCNKWFDWPNQLLYSNPGLWKIQNVFLLVYTCMTCVHIALSHLYYKPFIFACYQQRACRTWFWYFISALLVWLCHFCILKKYNLQLVIYNLHYINNLQLDQSVFDLIHNSVSLTLMPNTYILVCFDSPLVFLVWFFTNDR